jgi:DNA modification methylase
MHASSNALKVSVLPISQLHPDPANAREHPKRQVQQLAKSIQSFGFNCPVLIDGGRHVIAGHGRLLAAQLLGWHEVPTICLEHLTPIQAKAYRIADNRLTDISIWNDRLLAEQLQELSSVDLDFDLTAIGFELPEIDLRIQSLNEVEGEDTLPPSPSAVHVTRLGDVWNLGPHRLACGSALEPSVYELLMDGRQASLVFTDPPYNVPISGHVIGNGRYHHPEFAMASGEMSSNEFAFFLGTALANTTGVCGPGALLYVCMDWRHMGELGSAAGVQKLELKNLCVWDKGTGGMGSFYRSQHELIFVYRHDSGSSINNIQLGRFGRNRTNVWNYPGANSFARQGAEGSLLAMHPTVKPIALVSDALLDASLRGALVLDPFLGSGTTLLAAERTGRVACGIELDPRYVDLAIRRWQRLTGEHATLQPGGERFDDLERILQRGQATDMPQQGDVA